MSKKKKKRRNKKATLRKTVARNPHRIDVAYTSFNKGLAHWESNKLDKALNCFQKAIRAKPPEFVDMLEAMLDLGLQMERTDVILQAYGGLYRAGSLSPEQYRAYINSLLDEKLFLQAFPVIKKYRARLQETNLPKSKLRKQLAVVAEVEKFCQDEIRYSEARKEAASRERTAARKYQREQQRQKKKQLAATQAPQSKKDLYRLNPSKNRLQPLFLLP